VLIVVDGACDLSPTVGDRARITVVPFKIKLAGNPFTGDADELGRLFDSDAMLTSSPPDDLAFATAFGDDREILVITASTYLSSARDAAATSARRTLANVKIVDSRSFSAGCGLVIEELLATIESETAIDELGQLCEMIVEATHTYAIVDHPSVLTSHGLLSGTKLSRLFPHPVLGIRDRARLLRQARTRKRAVSWLARHSRELFGASPAAWALSYERADDVDDIVATFREEFRTEPAFVTTMNPTAAIHLGAGAIVLAVRARSSPPIDHRETL
jgi:DegV family protein with EDD domain